MFTVVGLKPEILPVNIKMKTATGEISSFLGQIAVELKLGKNLIKHKVLIANIPIEGILGMDFLAYIPILQQVALPLFLYLKQGISLRLYLIQLLLNRTSQLFISRKSIPSSRTAHNSKHK
jgi:hypothetical protein